MGDDDEPDLIEEMAVAMHAEVDEDIFQAGLASRTWNRLRPSERDEWRHLASVALGVMRDYDRARAGTGIP